jgi:hypothetical protein
MLDEGTNVQTKIRVVFFTDPEETLAPSTCRQRRSRPFSGGRRRSNIPYLTDGHQDIKETPGEYEESAGQRP